MHKLLVLAACLMLGACSGVSPSSSLPSAAADQSNIVRSNLEAIHNAQVVPLPLNPHADLPHGKADNANMQFGSSLSNYRVYSLQLKQGERYRLNVNSLCDHTCMGINKFALKPRAILMDAYGTVIPNKPARPSTVIGMTTLGWDGEAPEDGTYYLLVAADKEDIGRTIVIDDVWINNSPLMAVKVSLLDDLQPKNLH
ncbi:hypothetical protein DNK06_02220 [Pseudomonas daroniae]|uniref:Lipoprotein n=1 Tax=Phytopseudomonas daroniae TaxID=2487519 RepID=A0A4Q9QRW6_9GAMM|nr:MULTISPECIES: hypothetical protein [Pseudomonas]TBU83280.1 hypothetical protein DNK06_02220 [Pseudomonas daroniae]TBU84919.1 hypothetical protein DNK31_04600 [Pseudomonas sp. FRB 228]TBU93788.1 hypothetical protein DNJ99_05470 [Pseudomonas daroniae]